MTITKSFKALIYFGLRWNIEVNGECLGRASYRGERCFLWVFWDTDFKSINHVKSIESKQHLHPSPSPTCPGSSPRDTLSL